jgi:hypothetical protein
MMFGKITRRLCMPERRDTKASVVSRNVAARPSGVVALFPPCSDQRVGIPISDHLPSYTGE